MDRQGKDVPGVAVEPNAEDKPAQTSQLDEPPDGGLGAWLTTLGAWCCLFCGFGWVNSIGVFQAYYSQNQLRDYSQSDVAWILSVQVFLMQGLAPVFGKMFDSYGPRWLLVFGTLLHIFGLMMVSLSSQYYQIFLAQAICSGGGASALFYAGTNAVSTWFKRRRALALGIAASGSSISGLVVPIMFDNLIRSIGFAWTMRAIAFLFLGLMVVAICTVRSRLHHTPSKPRLADFVGPFGELPFVLHALGSFIFFWAYFIPPNYIVLYAERQGMSSRLAGYQPAILNATSIFGRILPAWAGDKLGRFNMQILMMVLTGTVLFAAWIPAHDNAAVVVFSALYGFTSGTFVSLLPALIAQMSDLRQIGVRVGVTYSVVSLAGLTGNPIGGALLQRDDGGYLAMQLFCGVAVALAAALLVTARVRIGGWKLAKV